MAVLKKLDKEFTTLLTTEFYDKTFPSEKRDILGKKHYQTGNCIARLADQEAYTLKNVADSAAAVVVVR